MGKVQRPDYLHFAESGTTQQKEDKMQLNWNGSISRFFLRRCQNKVQKNKGFSPRYRAKYLKSSVRSLRAPQLFLTHCYE